MQMIEKAVIVNMPTVEKRPQYLTVEFDDGTYVDLDEEELKNAAKVVKSKTVTLGGHEYKDCAALHHDD
jgi:DUF971 family protein